MTVVMFFPYSVSSYSFLVLYSVDVKLVNVQHHSSLCETWTRWRGGHHPDISLRCSNEPQWGQSC